MNVFIFPGQGSQEVGMGADLFKSDPAFCELVVLAGELVGEDLKTICLRGPEKKLVQTRLLQPLLVAVSLGYLRRLEERGVHPDLALGHSLGEITALAAAGVVTPPDAVRIAVKRGELMDAAAARVDGVMLAVTLEDRSKLLDWLASAPCAPCAPEAARLSSPSPPHTYGGEGRGEEVPTRFMGTSSLNLSCTHPVTLANDNAPTQVVLSGERSTIASCADFIAREKLGRCRLLAVSGPWHSPFMAEAAEQFETWLQQIPMQPPRVPMLLNATAARADTVADIRTQISRVLANPVRWTGCMTALRAMNPRCLFEIGPGRVLAGVARANGFSDTTRILHVNNLRGVDSAWHPRT
jgi:[acyl-carrier-protein] S-malonyltransferase